MNEMQQSAMTKLEAAAITQRIRATVDGLWNMLLEAHDRQAWKALGYASWAAYVEGEFDMGRQYSYRLLDQGRVIKAIEDATGKVSPMGDIPERTARDLKPDLPAVTEEIRSRVEAGEDAEKAVAETVAAKRAERKAKQAEHDRQREENAAKLPEVVKQQQVAREAAIDARKAKPEERLSDADRIAELDEAVRVLEAENAALKAENQTFAEMRAQWQAGGFEAVIDGKDEDIRTLKARLYGESADKAAWMRSSNFWKEEARKLGWSSEAVIDIEPRAVSHV